jgi:hypothetical protein
MGGIHALFVFTSDDFSSRSLGFVEGMSEAPEGATSFGYNGSKVAMFPRGTSDIRARLSQP